jgi:hypothetical protein
MRILSATQFSLGGLYRFTANNGYSLRIYRDCGAYHVEVFNPQSIKVIWSVLQTHKQVKEEVSRLKQGVLK